MSSDDVTVRHVLALLDRLSNKTLNSAVLQFKDHTQRFYDSLSELKNLNRPSGDGFWDAFSYPPAELGVAFSKNSTEPSSQVVQEKCTPLRSCPNSTEVQECTKNNGRKLNTPPPQVNCTPTKLFSNQQGIENYGSIKKFSRKSRPQRKPRNSVLPQRVTRSRAKQMSSTDGIALKNTGKTPFVVLQDDFPEVANEQERVHQRNPWKSSDGHFRAGIAMPNCPSFDSNQMIVKPGLHSHETVVSENKICTPTSIRNSKCFIQEMSSLKGATRQIGLLPFESSPHRACISTTPSCNISNCDLHFRDEAPKLNTLRPQSNSKGFTPSPKSHTLNSPTICNLPSTTPGKGRTLLKENRGLALRGRSDIQQVGSLLKSSMATLPEPPTFMPSGSQRCTLPKSLVAAMPKSPTLSSSTSSLSQSLILAGKNEKMLGQGMGLPLRAQPTVSEVGTVPDSSKATLPQSRTVIFSNSEKCTLPKFSAAALPKSPTISSITQSPSLAGQDKKMVGQGMGLPLKAQSIGSGLDTLPKSPKATLPESQFVMLSSSINSTSAMPTAVKVPKSPAPGPEYLLQIRQDMPLLESSTLPELLQGSSCLPWKDRSIDVGLGTLPKSLIAMLPDSPVAMRSRSITSTLPPVVTLSSPLMTVLAKSCSGQDSMLKENSDPPLQGQSVHSQMDILLKVPMATSPESPMVMLSRSVKPTLTSPKALISLSTSKSLIEDDPKQCELKLQKQLSTSTKDRVIAASLEKSDAFEFHVIPSIQKQSPRLIAADIHCVNLENVMLRKRKLSVCGHSSTDQHTAKKWISPSCNSPLYEAFFIDEKSVALVQNPCEDKMKTFSPNAQSKQTFLERLNTPRTEDHKIREESHQLNGMILHKSLATSDAHLKGSAETSLQDQIDIVKTSSFAPKDTQGVLDDTYEDNFMEPTKLCTIGGVLPCEQSEHCMLPRHGNGIGCKDQVKVSEHSGSFDPKYGSHINEADSFHHSETILQYESEIVTSIHNARLQSESNDKIVSPSIQLLAEPETFGSLLYTRLQVGSADTSLSMSSNQNVSIEKPMDARYPCLHESVGKTLLARPENMIPRNKVEPYSNQANACKESQDLALNVHCCKNTLLRSFPASSQLEQNTLFSPLPNGVSQTKLNSRLPTSCGIMESPLTTQHYSTETLVMDEFSRQTSSIKQCTSCVPLSKAEEDQNTQISCNMLMLKASEDCNLEVQAEKSFGQVTECGFSGKVGIINTSPRSAESLGEPSSKKKDFVVEDCNLKVNLESPSNCVNETEKSQGPELCQLSSQKTKSARSSSGEEKNNFTIEVSNCVPGLGIEQGAKSEGKFGDGIISSKGQSPRIVDLIGKLANENQNDLSIEGLNLKVKEEIPCSCANERELPRRPEAFHMSPLYARPPDKSSCENKHDLIIQESIGVPEMEIEQRPRAEGDNNAETIEIKLKSPQRVVSLSKPTCEMKNNSCKMPAECTQTLEMKQATDYQSYIGDDTSDTKSEMDCSESPVKEECMEDGLSENKSPKEPKCTPNCDAGFLKFRELLAQGTVNSSRRKRPRSPGICSEESCKDLKRLRLPTARDELLKYKGFAHALHSQCPSIGPPNFSPVRRFRETFGMTFGDSPSKSIDTTDFESWQRQIVASDNLTKSYPMLRTLQKDYVDTPHIRSVRIASIDRTSVKSNSQNLGCHLITRVEEDEKENQSPKISNRDSEASILSDWQLSVGTMKMPNRSNDSFGQMEDLHKHYNLSINTKSFLDLVPRKQVPLQHLNGKREVRVKALEAAEAARKLEEKREIERKRKRLECAGKGVDLESTTGKVTDKVKRVAELKMKMDQEKARKQEVEQNRKEEERRKKEADLACKKRKQEDADKREREEKRKRVEEVQRLRKEQEERQRAELNEKELKRKLLEERERERKAQEEEAKRQRRLEKEREAERRRKHDQHIKATRYAEKQAERKRKEAILLQSRGNEDDEFLAQIAHSNKLSFLSTDSFAISTSNDLEAQSKGALGARSQTSGEMWSLRALSLGTSACQNDSERLTSLVENEALLSNNMQMTIGLGADIEPFKNMSYASPFMTRSDILAPGQLIDCENNIQSYEISPYKSSSDDEDDDQPKKPVPLWARKENLLQQLLWQQPVNPELIFSSAKTCSLSEIFGTRGSRKCKDFTQRSASGDWVDDHATWKEEMDYKKAMGYI